jgi:hypothetical protein
MATQEHVSDIVPAVPEPSPRLAARVRAVNRANDRANELHPELISIIRPFLGSKVTKADGSLTAKVQKALPDFPYDLALHVYRQSSDAAKKSADAILDAIHPFGTTDR